MFVLLTNPTLPAVSANRRQLEILEKLALPTKDAHRVAIVMMFVLRMKLIPAPVSVNYRRVILANYALPTKDVVRRELVSVLALRMN